MNCKQGNFVHGSFNLYFSSAICIQIIRKTKRMFGKLDIAVFYPLYREFDIWDNDVSVCSTSHVMYRFGLSSINCHNKLIRNFWYICTKHKVEFVKYE